MRNGANYYVHRKRKVCTQHHFTQACGQAPTVNIAHEFLQTLQVIELAFSNKTQF